MNPGMELGRTSEESFNKSERNFGKNWIKNLEVIFERAETNNIDLRKGAMNYDGRKQSRNLEGSGEKSVWTLK